MPKVEFKPMSLEDNIEIVKWCYHDENEDGLLSLHELTLNLFPELKNISENVNIDKYIEEFVTKKYSEKFDIIKTSVSDYQKFWDKYNDDFFRELSSYLNIEWPKDKDIVTATIGIIPVSPRNLKEFSFSTHEDMNEDYLVETCAHECCHFLWFEKWKELYPDYKEEEFETPHIIWEYSEAVVDPILNSEGFVSLFNKKTRYAYDSFYENDNMMERLFDIYNKDEPIEEKIKSGFKYIKDMDNNSNKKTL